jgi:hypothetical protein
MRICTKHYTGTKGVYAHFTPDYRTTHLLTGLVWYTHPPFATHSVPYTSHVTAVCSDNALRTLRIPYPKAPVFTKIARVEYWKQNGKGIAVFILDSPIFKHVHSLFLQRGAKHRYPDYVPHVTIALNLDVPDEKMHQWAHHSTQYVHREKHVLAFNRLKVRDMQF